MTSTGLHFSSSGKKVHLVTSKRKTVKDVDKKVNKLAAKVAKGDEDKYLDIANSVTSVDWNGTNVVLNTPPQSSTGQGREGDRILCKYLDLNMELNVAAAGASSMRVMVIWDKNLTLGNINQVLSSTGAATSVISPPNKEWRDHYYVLYDRQFILDTTNKNTYIINKRIKLNKNTVFQAGTNTLRTGGLRILMISNQPAAGAQRPLFIQLSRLHYSG